MLFNETQFGIQHPVAHLYYNTYTLSDIPAVCCAVCSNAKVFLFSLLFSAHTVSSHHGRGTAALSPIIAQHHQHHRGNVCVVLSHWRRDALS